MNGRIVIGCFAAIAVLLAVRALATCGRAKLRTRLMLLGTLVLAVYGSVEISPRYYGEWHPGPREAVAAYFPGPLGIYDIGYLQALINAGAGGVWPMNDPSGSAAFADISGNGNNATITGTWTYQVAGPLNEPGLGASNSSSTGNYASVASAASLPSGDTLTVLGFVKRNGTSATLIAQGSGGLSITMGSGTNILSMGQVGVGTICSSSTAISDTTLWHFFASVKNGSYCYLNLDGVNVTTLGTNHTLSPSNSALTIGALNSTTNPANAELFGLAVFNSALSPTQITDIYNLATGRLRVAVANGVAISAVPTIPVVMPSGVAINAMPSVNVNAVPTIPVVMPSGVAINSAPTLNVTEPTVDPCKAPAVVPTQLPISLPSATTSPLLAGTTGKSIFICACYWDMPSVGAGTPSPALQLFAPSATTSLGCPTPTTLLGGSFSYGNHSLGYGGMMGQSGAGKGLCAQVSGGGGAMANGFCTVVVQ